MLRKKNFLVVTILILLVFLVTGCNLFPKPTKGIISGRVLMPPSGKELSRDVSGWVPAANATVTIVDASGVTHTVITDANGYYTFENIAVKANTVVTATVKVDGKTMVLKTVIDKAVKEDGEYDSGKMTPESTALALVVEKLVKEGKVIDLEEIKKASSFDDLVKKVNDVLEEHGNVTTDSGVKESVDETTEEVVPPPAPPTVEVSGVSITGEAVVGKTLTAAVTPSAATVTYRWLWSDSENTGYKAINGATSKNYTITNSYAGKYIRVEVTGTGNYTGTKLSAAVGKVVKVIKGLTVYAREGATNCDKIEVGNVTKIADGEFEVTVTGTGVLETLTGNPGGSSLVAKWFGLQLKPEDVTDITVLAYKTAVQTTFADLEQADADESGVPGEIVWWINGNNVGSHYIWLKYKDEADRTAIKLTVKFKYKEEVLEEVLAELNNLFTDNTYNGMNNVQVADEYRGHLITLGLPAGENTRYDALDERDENGEGTQRHTAVFIDLWFNMPDGGYELATLTQYFNEIVETRHVTKRSVELVDEAIDFFDINNNVPDDFGLEFVEILNAQFTSVHYTYHSRVSIANKIEVLDAILYAWDECETETKDNILYDFLSELSVKRSQDTIIKIGTLLGVENVDNYIAKA